MAGPYYLGQGQYREGSGGNGGGYVVTAPIAVSNLKINESFFEPGQIKDVLRIEPGQSVTFSFTIVNVGHIVDWFWLSVIGVPSTWVQQQPVLTESIKLNPQDSQTVKLTITPPREPESRAGHYFLRIQVVGHRAPGQLEIIRGTLEVLSFYEFKCDLLPLQPASVAEGIYEVVVSNDGNTDLTVKLEAREIGRQSRRQCDYNFERRPLLTVPAAQARSVNLIVQARQWPVAETKTHPFVVMATRLNSEQREEKEGSWEQTQPNFRLTLQPKRRETVGKGSFMVLVSNHSEVDLDLTLAGEDEEQGCRYSFDPARLTTRANEEEEVDLIIRPAVRLRRRDPKSYPFTITAWPINAPEVIRKAEGEWVQLPSAFKLLSLTQRLLLALLIFLVAMMLGLYFLLKPPPLVIKYLEVRPTKIVLGGNQTVEVIWWAGYDQSGPITEIVQEIRTSIADWIDNISNKMANTGGEPQTPISNEESEQADLKDIKTATPLKNNKGEASESLLSQAVRWIGNKTEAKIIIDQATVTAEWTGMPVRGTVTNTLTNTTRITFIVSNSEMTLSTVVPIEVQTPTPTVTPTPTPTATPTPTNTPIPPAPCLPSVISKESVGVFLGPGFDYQQIGTLAATPQPLRSWNPQKTWWQIEYKDAPEGFAWIPAALHYYKAPPCNVDSLSTVEAPATPTPTPTATVTALPTATPTPYYYFEVSVSPDKNTCARLQWEVRYVDKVYLEGLDKDNLEGLLPPFPGRPELVGAPGEPRQDPREDCPDSAFKSSTVYAMHVFHWGDGHECKISYTYSETYRLFVKTFDDCHKEGQ